MFVAWMNERDANQTSPLPPGPTDSVNSYNVINRTGCGNARANRGSTFIVGNKKWRDYLCHPISPKHEEDGGLGKKRRRKKVHNR